jgi:molybdopterin-guanine dinucleotide biosynthesis protein A
MSYSQNAGREIDVSGIILAGGSSSRLGADKALIPVSGRPLIEWVVATLRSVVSGILLVTNDPERFAFLGLPMAGDIYHGIGTLGGLHAGLSAMGTPYGLVVGCDMPFLNADLLRYMISLAGEYDAVVPRVGEYYEPLHAIYSRRCLAPIERSIVSGQHRVLSACAGMRVRYLGPEEIARYDPRHDSFFNVNTPNDLDRMNEILKEREDLSPAQDG